ADGSNPYSNAGCVRRRVRRGGIPARAGGRDGIVNASPPGGVGGRSGRGRTGTAAADHVGEAGTGGGNGGPALRAAGDTGAGDARDVVRQRRRDRVRGGWSRDGVPGARLRRR